MLIIMYMAIVVVLLGVCDNRFSKKLYIPLKTISSIGFLVIGIIYGYGADDYIYRNWIVTALVACAIGDIALAVYNQIKERKAFLIGMACFVIAHISLILAMNWLNNSIGAINAVIPLAAIAAFFAIKKLAHIHMGKLTYFCAGYSLIVASMMAKALMLPENRIVSVAGVLFFISDCLIVFLYFFHFKDNRKKRLIHHLNLITYYVAVLLFAVSV
ncbi:MAG: hypothetical protein HUJ71_04360 [Pseudobutyrivibrio sp.]|nr:hypothetical protein [Pseudobutyrivibrio sp.]